jgi:hypothetical protein
MTNMPINNFDEAELDADDSCSASTGVDVGEGINAVGNAIEGVAGVIPTIRVEVAG